MARLVPITVDGWQDLINSGEVVVADEPLGVDGLEPKAYSYSGSGVLESLRSDER